MKRDTFRVFCAVSDAIASPESRQVLLERSTSEDPRVRQQTASIVHSVRQDGDAALRTLAQRFDDVILDSLEVPRARVQASLDALSPDLRCAMERSAANIARVHAAVTHTVQEVETEPGIRVGRRADPLERVGIYAPGGRASYPSSVLMGAIPARCARVPEIILCSPPGRDGLPAATVLAAAALGGVHRVFSLGGAGAIAAMALGTQSVPRVQKIVGPGNAYVAEAKLQLSGYVSFDSPAGPSELLVIADENANDAVIAREMLAQAEHDPLAAVVTICASRGFAEQLLAEIERLLPSQPRRDIMTAALGNRGAILWYDSVDDAILFANTYAPEHLLIAAADGNSICARIRNAGTIFIGEHSSVAFGDYMTGANHVLPTGSLARSYSGLSTNDFVRWTTYQEVSPSAARSLAIDVSVFATAENLPAHAAAALAWRKAQ